MSEITTWETPIPQPNRPKSSRWKKAVQATGVAAALTLGWAGYKFTDPGQDRREARVFNTPYSEVVDGFIKNNPDWVSPKNGASTSIIGKSNNLPYEGPPVALWGPDKKLIDLAYPQWPSLADRISLAAFLEKNNLPATYLPRLHDILISEHVLMSDPVRFLRKHFPDTFLASWADRSHSAMKVKPRFIYDFSPLDQRKIIMRAMTYQIQPASRDRAITLWRPTLQTDGPYQSLYQILGYPDAQSATTAFIAWDIDTKTEAWFALGMSLLEHIQANIEEGMQKTWVTTDVNGGIRASFPAELYTNNIYPIIKDEWGYRNMTRPTISMQESAIDTQISTLKTEIDAIPDTPKNQKKITWLKWRLSNLEWKKAELKTAREEELRKALAHVANSHFTMSRSDLNTVWKLLTEIDRAAAYYPTHIDRAFGKRWSGTHDQFMLNLIAWNTAFGKTETPSYINIDGDPWDVTEALMKRYGLTDDAQKKERYDRTRDQSLRNIVAWKGQIDDTIWWKDTPFPKDLSSLIRLSFEHRYVFVRILTSYLRELESIPWVDKGAIAKMYTTIESAWSRYITDMDEKPFQELVSLVSHPASFAEHAGIRDHQDRAKYLQSFYARWMIPRLEATTYHLSVSGIVMPMIQTRARGFTLSSRPFPTNTTNTLARAIIAPSSTISLDPTLRQDFRRAPAVVPSGNGWLFSEQYYDTRPIQVAVMSEQ